MNRVHGCENKGRGSINCSSRFPEGGRDESAQSEGYNDNSYRGSCKARESGRDSWKVELLPRQKCF